MSGYRKEDIGQKQSFIATLRKLCYNARVYVSSGYVSAKGIDWKNVSFVISTREDLVPEPQRKTLFFRECENCKARAYVETEYPHDVPVICNVCASQVTAQIEQDPSTLLLYDMPNDVKARIIDIALQRRLPVEAVMKDFLEWKLGRPSQASFYNKPEKEKAKE